MTDPAPDIYRAIVAVQADLGKIAKDGKGPSTQGGYPYLKVDALVERLQPLLATHGIAVIPNQVECWQDTYRFPKVNMQKEPVYDGRPDAVQIITRVKYDFTFASIEDGSTVLASAYGESQDSGDKGIRRASTAAWKEVLLRIFVVVSGDQDPEDFDPTAEPAQEVRQDRGEQQRTRAANGKAERAPRAPRTPRGATPPAAADAPVEPAASPDAAAAEAPATEAEPTVASEPEEAPAQTAERAPARRPRAAAPEKFEVTKEDIAAAEEQAPAAPEAREPSAADQITKPTPETQADKRYESVMDIRKAIRTALDSKGKDRDYVNELGDRLTGKPRGQWFANLNDLHVVLKAIDSGEDEEAGF